MSNQSGSMLYKRQAFAKDQGDGVSSATWTLTPVGIEDPVQLIAQPICTVPIIFVPGIMGSNLKLTSDIEGKKKGDAVWMMNGKARAAADWLWRSAATRQLRLNPATTTVDDSGDVPALVPTIGDAEAIRKSRYWGEVSAMSYQGFLVWLESTLNDRKRVHAWRGELGERDYAKLLAPGMQFEPLTEATVGHAANLRFPVYACGYNWLQSNLESAKTLTARIKQVIEANNSKSYRCQKVILVTHSMGGLVARACSELLAGRDLIAGIVHGVMPATGAAVAYMRVRSGTEGGTGPVIGPDAATVTAVFANSPGALQLLPSKLYGPGWLQLGVGSGTEFIPSIKLPETDPYEEIYKNRTAWWGLMREELVNPANLKSHEGWASYTTNIGKAANFHQALGKQYHANTIAFHGDGKDAANGLTWGKVRWQAVSALDLRREARKASERAPVSTSQGAVDLRNLRRGTDSGEGKVTADASDGVVRYEFKMGEKDSAGDGTVPVVSGQAPAQAGVRASYHINVDGEGHEGAFRVDQAQRLTLHSILRIASQVPVLEL